MEFASMAVDPPSHLVEAAPASVDPIDQEVGARIRLRRQLVGMTQRRLAAAIGVAPHQVQKYETGDNRVAASTLVAIAGALECPAWTLLPNQNPGAAASSPWPEVTPESLGLLSLFQAAPAEYRPSFMTICRRLAEPD